MSLFKKKKEEDEAEALVPDLQDNQLSETSEVPEPPEVPENPESSESSKNSESSENSAPQDPVLRLAAAIRAELESGSLGEDTRTLLTRALNYQDDMDRAVAEAELRGRNAAIEEHLHNLDHGDGIPHPGCGQGTANASARFSIFDLARGAK